jgi:hypothetical protein
MLRCNFKMEDVLLDSLRFQKLRFYSRAIKNVYALLMTKSGVKRLFN